MAAALRKLDLRVLRAMRIRGHSSGAEETMKALGTAGEWGIVWAMIALVAAAADERRRARWHRAALVAPGAVGANFLVKLVFRRPRPRLRRLPPLAGAPSALSFPSAHATSSFAAATAMSRIEPRSAPPLFALALAMCLTRPYLGMHYPSDVLAGAALGAVLGRLAPVGTPLAEERLMDLAAPRAS